MLTLVLVLALPAGGCADDAATTTTTPSPAPTTTGTAATVAPAPPKPPPQTTPQAVPKLPDPTPPVPSSRQTYLQRLDDLAARLDPAITRASQTGDSTPIAKIDDEVMRATKAWSRAGKDPSPAAEALAAAIATARSNVETPLLAGESRRQVAPARAALADELAAAG